MIFNFYCTLFLNNLILYQIFNRVYRKQAFFWSFERPISTLFSMLVSFFDEPCRSLSFDVENITKEFISI